MTKKKPSVARRPVPESISLPRNSRKNNQHKRKREFLIDVWRARNNSPFMEPSGKSEWRSGRSVSVRARLCCGERSMAMCGISWSSLKGDEMPRKEFIYLAAGVLLAMVLQSTIAGFLNPILAPAKLTYA